MGFLAYACLGCLAGWVVYSRRAQQAVAVLYDAFKCRPGHWLLGNLVEMEGPKMFEYLRSCIEDLDSTAFGTWMAGSFMVSLDFISICFKVHPDALEPAMNKSIEKPFNYQFFRTFLGKRSILVDHNKIWQMHRRIATPMFLKDALKGYFLAYVRAGNTLIDKLTATGGKSFDCNAHTGLLTLDVVLQAGFGHISDCQTVDSIIPECFSKMNVLVWKRTQNPLMWPDIIFNWMGDGRTVKKYADHVDSFCADLLSERRAEVDYGRRTCEHKDFMDYMLDAKMEDVDTLSLMKHLMFAAFDTGAVSMAWILYALAEYPEWQERCRVEALTAFGDDGDTPSFEQLAKLETCTMFIKESLRMWPPVPILGRINSQEFSVNEKDARTIPLSTWLSVEVWGCHHNPAVWPNPEKFDPERFNRNRQIKPFSFLPFSAGPRSCVGKEFGMNELKTILAMVLRKFKIVRDETLPKPVLLAEVMLLAKDGLRVRAIPLAESDMKEKNANAEYNRKLRKRVL